MNFKHENHHMVDVLFVLTLFFVFALSALTLVVLGASVYRNSVDYMDASFQNRTSYAYVTQKIRQADHDGSITCGTFDGAAAVILTDEIGDTLYNTYLYEYDGYLCELLTRADLEMKAKSGTKITPIKEFDIKEISDDLYKFEITSTNDENYSLLISTHSETGGNR